MSATNAGHIPSVMPEDNTHGACAGVEIEGALGDAHGEFAAGAGSLSMLVVNR